MEHRKVYTSDLNIAQKPSKCVIRGDYSCEVTSDDETMRITLQKQYIYNRTEQVNFLAVIYIKEGDGWIRTSSFNTFQSIEDFFSSLNQTDDFSQAINEFNTINNK